MAIQGWKASAAYRARRILGAIPGVAFHRYVLVAVPVAAMPPALSAGLHGAACPPEAAIAAGLTDPVAAAWRTRQGMDCVGLWRRDVLIAVTWLGEGAFDEDEAWLTFKAPAGEAWDTGMQIAEGARGGRAFAALWAATRGWAQARGIGWSVSRIADYNIVSRRAHARLGAVEVGRVSVLRVGDWQVCSGARPRVMRVGGVRAVVQVRVPQ
jgi:hypothetical protein